MLLQPGACGIALPDVDGGQVARLGGATKDVDAGLGELRPGLRLAELRAGADDRPPGPVRLLDDAEAVRGAVGQEDADGEPPPRRARHRQLSGLFPAEQTACIM